MELVELAIVAANLFASGMKKITIAQLNEVEDLLTRSLPGILIFNGRDEIAYMLERYPRIFSEDEDDNIIRGYYAHPLETLLSSMEHFNMPESVLPEVKKILRDGWTETMTQEYEKIFEREYIDRYFTRRVPAKSRAEFKKICREFAAQELAKAVAVA